jgi:hypothetical protein
VTVQCPPDRDFYSVLGVEPNATSEQIHGAYRTRVRISHPDRFDRDTHPEEWKVANELLRDLNAAYSILRDEDSREEYDLSRERKHATDEPRPEKVRARSGQPSFTSACSVRLSDLSSSLQQRLLERQKNVNQDQVQVSTGSVLGHFVLICPLFFWFGFLYAASYGARWKGSTNLWQGAVTLIVAWLIAGQIIAILRWFASALKSYFYITPLYFIKTDHCIITFWPIFALQDIAFTHHYVNGGYDKSTAVLKFEGHSETLEIRSKEQVEDLFSRLKFYDARLRKAHAEDDDNYFQLHDDFAGVPRTGIPADTTLSQSTMWRIRAATIAACGVAYFFFVTLNGNLAAQKWVQHPTTYPVARSAAPGNVPRRVPKPVVPEQSLPTNGHVLEYGHIERVAPLEIQTQSGLNYLVKLVDARTKSPVLTVFVVGGTTVNVDVPLGTYEVRYTCGDSWYGYQYLFGDSGSYSKADDLFAFTQSGSKVTGYTITLFPVEHGNLKTEYIAPTAF